jgi:hypothetical protein
MTEKTYTGAEFAPVFYRAMAEWHEGGCVGGDPRERWEANQPMAGTWAGSIDTPSFNVCNTYRWKPKQKRLVTIGYRDKFGTLIAKTLVAPKTVAPDVGVRVHFLESLSEPWTDNEFQKEWMRRGKMFLTSEDRDAMADWLAVCRNGGGV